MNLARTARWLLLAFLVSLVPATSHAGVFISVGFAPPPLLVYDQPPCPEPGWIWTPGYWAYGDDGYYWVPGTWVPAPYEGALWTPGYWGWNTGLYMWHPGYWGPHVGYYGGVNYGFGYMGVGFVGGRWHGGVFEYNTAVWHVDRHVIRNVYIDRTIVERNTIINDRHVAYSGGPGGIRHDPDRDERRYMGERHMEATSYQTEHRMAAMHDRDAYFNNNHGRPDHLVASRPMNYGDQGGRNGFQQNRGANPAYQNGRNQENRPNQNWQQGGPQGQFNGRPDNNHREAQQQNRPQQFNNQNRPNENWQQQQNRQQQQFNQNRGNDQNRQQNRQQEFNQNRPANQNWQQQNRQQQQFNQNRGNDQNRQQNRQQEFNQIRPANQNWQQQNRQQQQFNQRPQFRPQPQSRPAPHPQERPQPRNEEHGHGH